MDKDPKLPETVLVVSPAQSEALKRIDASAVVDGVAVATARAIQIMAEDGLRPEDRERLAAEEAAEAEAAKRAEEEDLLAFAIAQNRARAVEMLASMPDFWKAKLKRVANEHFKCRKGRRATAKVLRDYETWQRGLARTKEKQADDKVARGLSLSQKVFDRDAMGLPPPRSVSAEVLERVRAGADPGSGSTSPPSVGTTIA
jgi:hypothetical protein